MDKETGLLIKKQISGEFVGEREDITVPAGTFTCFRVTFYGDDDVLKTSWYSDSAKHWVKTIYSETGEIYELMSYSNQ